MLVNEIDASRRARLSFIRQTCCRPMKSERMSIASRAAAYTYVGFVLTSALHVAFWPCAPSLHAMTTKKVFADSFGKLAERPFAIPEACLQATSWILGIFAHSNRRIADSLREKSIYNYNFTISSRV